MSAQARKQQPMCVVRIGYGKTLLMELSAGNKVIELLSRAVEVDEDFYSKEARYTVIDHPRIELAMVKASQVRASANGGQPRLGEF